FLRARCGRRRVRLAPGRLGGRLALVGTFLPGVLAGRLPVGLSGRLATPAAAGVRRVEARPLEEDASRMEDLSEGTATDAAFGQRWVVEPLVDLHVSAAGTADVLVRRHRIDYRSGLEVALERAPGTPTRIRNGPAE